MRPALLGAALGVCAFLAPAALALMLASHLHVSDALEATCIKGRLSPTQAAAINAHPWQRSPGYCAGNGYTSKEGNAREGQTHCGAEAGDRIIAAHCSAFLAVLREGD